MDARELYAHIFDACREQMVGSDTDSEERLTISSAHAGAAINCLVKACDPTHSINLDQWTRTSNGLGAANKVRDVPIGDREQNAEGDL